MDSGGVAGGAEPVSILEMMPSNVRGLGGEAGERAGSGPGVFLEGGLMTDSREVRES